MTSDAPIIWATHGFDIYYFHVIKILVGCVEIVLQGNKKHF
jgi:hypothetical protein